MFRSNCRVIFRPIFGQEECTTDNAFNLRDILQELFKIIVVCYIRNLTRETSPPYFSMKEPQPMYTPHNHAVNFTLSIFNACFIKCHIWILILSLLYNTPQLFQPILVRRDLVIWSIISCTLQLFEDQPEDGYAVGPKHVASIII